jgi:hypothetical protein
VRSFSGAFSKGGCNTHRRKKKTERKIIMKCTIIALATAFVLSFGSPAQAADKECSNATLKGAFAYTNTGFITAPAPIAGLFAGVGIQNLDGNGGTTATAWVSQNGNILQVTIKGTYTVNPDCTGTLTLQISPLGITSHAVFVIDADGAEFRAINTDAGSVITTVAKRQ